MYPGFPCHKGEFQTTLHRVLYQIFFPELFQGRGAYVGCTETLDFSISEGLSYVRPDQQKGYVSKSQLRVIKGFGRKLDEICALLLSSSLLSKN
jgi:hypothetical protein